MVPARVPHEFWSFRKIWPSCTLDMVTEDSCTKIMKIFLWRHQNTIMIMSWDNLGFLNLLSTISHRDQIYFFEKWDLWFQKSSSPIFFPKKGRCPPTRAPHQFDSSQAYLEISNDKNPEEAINNILEKNDLLAKMKSHIFPHSCGLDNSRCLSLQEKPRNILLNLRPSGVS